MPELRDLLNDVGAATLQSIGDALDVGILAVDHQLVITAWNRWLEDISGKPAGEVVGRPLSEVIPGLRPRARAALEQAVNGATVILSHRFHEYMIEMPPPSGYERFARMQQSVRIIPMRASGGSTHGAVALIQDVTERVAREQDLRAAMEEAQSANRAKADFLAAMSHELRTPIGAMSGYADLLADGLFGEVTPTQREQLLRIKSVGTHLAAIVEQILTYARVEAGHETLRITSVDVSAIARDAVQAVAPLAAKKGLALTSSPVPTPLTVDTDEVKVRQILINLLGNGIKFTEAGAVSLHISAKATTVELTITDTGPGIDRRDHERIFEPFVQVGAVNTRVHNGTGLGLSVSRTLARLLGGDVTLVSEPGHGSAFTFMLPRAPAAPVLPAVPPVD